MSTLQIQRNNLGQAIKCIDMVYSPDDGGWYFQEFNFPKRLTRTSRRIFPSAEAARQAFCEGQAEMGEMGMIWMDEPSRIAVFNGRAMMATDETIITDVKTELEKAIQIREKDSVEHPQAWQSRPER